MKTIFVFGVLCLGIFVFLHKLNEEPSLPYLKVMVYSSFLSPYGPAKSIQKNFESVCQCRIKWMKAEDSTFMTSMLKIREDGFGVDVVLGLDQITLFSEKNLWKPVSLQREKLIPQLLFFSKKENQKYTAIPISWSPLTFISRNERDLPKNLDSLLEDKKKLSLPHPRYSTVGLQFYFWLYSVFGEKKLNDFLKQLKGQVFKISHSWSSSYGVFQKKFSDLTFSYQSSVLYHQIEEKEKFYFARMDEKHPYQIELAAVVKTCSECKLAEDFIQFLLTKNIQEILLKKNYMLPSVRGIYKKEILGPSLPLISYEKMEFFFLRKKNLLDMWDSVFN